MRPQLISIACCFALGCLPTATPPAGTPDDGSDTEYTGHDATHDADTSDAGNPVHDVGADLPDSGTRGWRSVTVGANHVCAVTTENESYCWGANDDGQLGVGDTTPRTVPTPLFSPVDRLSASVQRTMGVRADGSVVGWGLNSSGQVSGVAGDDVLAPILINGVSLRPELATTNGFNCGIRASDRLVVCWGHNQETFNDMLGTQLPVAIDTSGVRFERISVSLFGVAAIDDTGQLWTWGRHPVAITCSNMAVCTQPLVHHEGTWIDVSLSEWHGCAVETNGDVACWGVDYELGTTTRTSKLGGTEVAIIPIVATVSESYAPFSQVTTGREHTCALTQGGDVVCWGS